MQTSLSCLVCRMFPALARVAGGQTKNQASDHGEETKAPATKIQKREDLHGLFHLSLWLDFHRCPIGVDFCRTNSD